MQIKDAIRHLAKMDMDSDICILWSTKPSDMNVYTWAYICDNFNMEILKDQTCSFTKVIEKLRNEYPFQIQIASGDVVFVEKVYTERTEIAQPGTIS